jgi:hypothetical protein
MEPTHRDTTSTYPFLQSGHFKLMQVIPGRCLFPGSTPELQGSNGNCENRSGNIVSILSLLIPPWILRHMLKCTSLLA